MTRSRSGQGRAKGNSRANNNNAPQETSRGGNKKKNKRHRNQRHHNGVSSDSKTAGGEAQTNNATATAPYNYTGDNGNWFPLKLLQDLTQQILESDATKKTFITAFKRTPLGKQRLGLTNKLNERISAWSYAYYCTVKEQVFTRLKTTDSASSLATTGSAIYEFISGKYKADLPEIIRMCQQIGIRPPSAKGADTFEAVAGFKLYKDHLARIDQLKAEIGSFAAATGGDCNTTGSRGGGGAADEDEKADPGEETQALRTLRSVTSNNVRRKQQALKRLELLRDAVIELSITLEELAAYWIIHCVDPPLAKYLTEKRQRKREALDTKLSAKEVVNPASDNVPAPPPGTQHDKWRFRRGCTTRPRRPPAGCGHRGPQEAGPRQDLHFALLQDLQPS